ncbi:GGDEF domain-containing protein [Sinorhizobium sp. BG8]|uniref:GGDEF domain-containing protein n=1 Tax=Sinorhizobium sp. BG8 TaxID=2613773 RepID=UPI00193E4E3B|nr:GGDEF domain-containing protein [Sinorhizobium sp. BG8]QRM56249.1 GGDEF domain-containing protein [Sinorhizobium sp. BG8]
MDNQLDLATVLLLHQCSFVVGTVCFLYARWQSRGGEGLGTLAFSFLSLALASTLAGLGERGVLPRDVWALGVSAVGVTGHALFWVGLRRLSSQKPCRADWSVLIVPAICVVFEFATQFHLVDKMRGSISNASACVFLAASALCVLQDSRQEPLPVRAMLAGSIATASLLALLVVVGLLWPDVAPMTPRYAFFLRIICHFAVALFVIILVKERAEAKLRHAAETDMLTGIGNRRWFMSKLPPVMLEGNALLLMDLDFFKQVNDRFGHDTGDIVLVSFAEVIGRHLRPGDRFARLGGEEFGLYMPKANAAEAMAMAERLRDVVSATVVESDGERVPLTVSIGVAASRHRYNGCNSLLSMADIALYEAKKSGRNRSVLFTSQSAAAA